MQYFTYQHKDGSYDVAPYSKFGGSIVISLAGNQDWLIMLARSNARERGASPLDIQIIVELLNDNDLLKYERN